MAMQAQVLPPPPLQEAVVGADPERLDLPSLGSADHVLGTCRPCAFYHSKGCSNGDANLLQPAANIADMAAECARVAATDSAAVPVDAQDGSRSQQRTLCSFGKDVGPEDDPLLEQGPNQLPVELPHTFDGRKRAERQQPEAMTRAAYRMVVLSCLGRGQNHRAIRKFLPAGSCKFYEGGAPLPRGQNFV